MTKKEEQYEARKWQILSIALNQFINYGYYGTSTRKIAEEAGISSGLMFHYFSSKLDLYEALVEIGCSKMSIVAREDDNPIVVFEKQVDWFLSVIKSNDFSTRMFLFMGLVAANAKEISSKAYEMIRNNDIIAQSVPIIVEGQRKGEIREGDPVTLSAFFYSSIQGIAEALAARDDLTIPDKEWFLSILRP